MEEKKSNLCVSADCTTSKQLFSLIEQIGPEICLLKTHIDILTDFTPDTIHNLQKAADHHNFLLFEDRKFADIGNTVKQQYAGGIYRIADWAHITNAHLTPGPGIVEGLKSATNNNPDRALLLLAQMSSKGNTLDKQSITLAKQWAQLHSDFIIGFIATSHIAPNFLHLTPGIHLHTNNDSLGQQYRTPETAIANGTDIIIVGRGIYNASSPQQTARKYRTRAWSAYSA